MPNHRAILFFACALLMLAACKPQLGSETRSAAMPPAPETASPPTNTPAQAALATEQVPATAMTGTADDGKQILRINTRSGSVDCSNRHVEVLSSHAELSFTGQCLELYFLGENTRASIHSAEMVQVVADNVGISTSAPVTELRQLGNAGQHRIGEVTGELYVQGDSNQIESQSVGELRLTGSRNRVHWRSGQPETSDLGNDNIIGAAR